MPNWLRRNWKTAGGAAVKNRDLWERLHAATGRHKIDWRWVKGHSGDPDNERVDVLARDEAVKLKAVAGTMLSPRSDFQFQTHDSNPCARSSSTPEPPSLNGTRATTSSRSAAWNVYTGGRASGR